jgi:putative membrane-bound dehydrogenase-like protein
MRRHHLACGLLAVLLPGLFVFVSADDPPPALKSPLAPDEALKTIRVPAGFAVELVAAEPHVMDPVAIAWDADGRLWVVEMGDYPDGEPGGKVKVLDDTDGDGRMDRSTVFVDRLPFPTGVFPWQGGVFVTAAPDLLYLKDTNGDGKADERWVVFTGFGEGNQQHRVNGLTWGIDNWIYGANGDSGGAIQTPARGDRPAVNISGRDFRFHPHTLALEPVSGQSQFGISFDDWGRRFLCNNRVHIRLEVLPDRYLKRNPQLAVRAVTEDIAEYGPVGARVYPISPPQERFNDFDHVGHFTAACGIHIYRGGLFPQEYEGSAFVCDAVGNLVHRCTLHPKGVSLTARRGEANREFFASTDPWCRPVNLATGPDGALYVVDYYRAVVEHPKWIPPEIQKRLDLRAGADRGRIYRVRPADAPRGPRPQLAKATGEDLVPLLAHPNGWWRDTAQRLLFERQHSAVAPALVEMATKHANPQARLRALWTLHGLGRLEPKHLITGLRDQHPGVREHALRMAEAFLSEAAVRDAVLALVDDPERRVRFQLAFTLGEMPTDRALDALARLAIRDADDAWCRTAVLSSLGGPKAPRFVALVLREDKAGFFKEVTPGKLQFIRELAAVISARGQGKEMQTFVEVLLTDDRPLRWQSAAVTGLTEGTFRGKAALPAIFGSEWSAVWPRFERVLQEAQRVVSAADEPLGVRVEAVPLLIVQPFAAAAPVYESLLDSRQPQELQLAAVQALGRRPEREALALLLKGWPSYSPGVRREVLEVVFRQRDRLPLLLDALAAGHVRPAELDAQRQRQLLNGLTGEQHQRAAALLGAAANADRRKVVEAYRDVLTLPRDASRGQAVFQKHCASCHRLDGQGKAVGPDLADVRGRPEESLLEDLLDPNRALAPAYVSYVVETHAGQLYTGIVAVETTTSLTLRRAEAAEDTILRQDIAALRATGQSLMPDGLEQLLTRQELADVIAYLKGPLKK